MPDEPESGFTVRDRRRFLSDASETSSSDATDAAKQEPPAAPKAAAVPPNTAPTTPPASGPFVPPSMSADPRAGASSSGAGASGANAGFAGPTPPGTFFGGQEADRGSAYIEEQEDDFGGMAAGGPGEEDQQIPDVYAYLMEFLGLMRAQALLRMGLIANPATGKPERDLEQAKIAIDTTAFLAAQIEPVIAPEERLPLRAMISDLQINFVEQSRRG